MVRILNKVHHFFLNQIKQVILYVFVSRGLTNVCVSRGVTWAISIQLLLVPVVEVPVHV